MKIVKEQYLKDSGKANAKMHDDNMLQAMSQSGSIEQQIEALTQELRPFPKEGYDHKSNDFKFYFFDEESMTAQEHFNIHVWYTCAFVSTNKAEVEEYADCYRRLKLYQLLGKKAEKEFPLDWTTFKQMKIGYDASQCWDGQTGIIYQHQQRKCCLGGVYFAREEDFLEAIEMCGIDAEFQKRCAKYGLGGA